MNGKYDIKKNWLPQPASHGGWVGAMCAVGGRVREGNPPNFGLTWALWFKTPATGAVDLDGYAAIPPTP